MATRYTKHYSTKITPQSEPIPGKQQVKNEAGGFVFKVDDWTRLDRFLILGTEGGTYYANEREITIDNAEAVKRCIHADGERVVRRIGEISYEGRAPKNDPALFALAMVMKFGDEKAKFQASVILPQVARIGTHLFMFIEYLKAFRGWSHQLRRMISEWYNGLNIDKLAYQVIKYRQRDGISHRDVLRLAHPKPPTPEHNALYRWIVSGHEYGDRKVQRGDYEYSYDSIDINKVPKLVHTFNALQGAEDITTVCKMLKLQPSLSWEMVPTQFLGEKKVWGTLLPNLPMTATLRNLGRMTANGLLGPMNKETNMVCERLVDKERIEKARIHPIAVLAAINTYKNGHGARGNLSWAPITKIVDALDDMFYLSFGNVKSTGKRFVLGLDVSSSMEWGSIASIPDLTPSVASAAMALITAKTEKNYTMMAFSHNFVPINISPRMRLDTVLKTMHNMSFGGTDCALPMLWALQKKVEADVFIVYTDNETWAGNVHPAQALNEYRHKMGISAKLIVVGMTATECSIGDNGDAGTLDVVGFDTASPNIISDFVIH